jgi:hypothetical protein
MVDTARTHRGLRGVLREKRDRRLDAKVGFVDDSPSDFGRSPKSYRHQIHRTHSPPAQHRQPAYTAKVKDPHRHSDRRAHGSRRSDSRSSGRRTVGDDIGPFNNDNHKQDAGESTQLEDTTTNKQNLKEGTKG